MINSNSHQFLFVSRLRTDSGSEEKIQYWNSKKQKEFALPCTMSVIEEEGVLSFKDMLTGQVVESVTLEQLLTEADGVALKLSPTHEIKIMRPSAIPGAYEDQTQFALGRVQSSALSVFLYEGAGHQLTRFDRVNKEEITDGFKLQVSSDGVMVSPIHAHLMKNGEVLRSPARISFNEFGKTELRVGNQWWKFGYFPAPVILDESEYEILDPAESKQDILFKTFLTASIAMGALMLGWMTWVSPMLADQRPVLETAEIKIDRNNLVAKSIQEEAPKPVAEMTPAAPPVVQPEVKVVAQPVPETPAPKAPAPKAPGPNAPKFAKQKPSSAPIQKIGPTVAMKTPGPGKTGTGTPGTGTGSNALLTRHSKMLQDAFGSVMAMKGSNPSAATPEVAGGISGVNGAALGKGKGFFNTGNGRGIASVGSGEGTGVAGNLVNGADPQQFVKVASGGPLGAKGSGNGGYGGGSGKIEVTGQGSGGGGVGMGYGGGGGGGASLSHSEVASVFQKHVSEIRMCYESAMLTQPDLQGTVALAFEIQPNGSVKGGRIKEANFGKRSPASAKDTVLTDCLLKRLSSWTFPKPHDGRKVDILSYPLVFKSLGNGNE